MASVDLPGLLNTLALPLLGVVTTGIGVLWRRGGGLRGRLRADLELLKALPEGSQGQRRLQEHVDATVERLVQVDSAMRRDWSGTALAVVLLIIAVLTGVTAWRLGGWWALLLWPTAAAFALFGAVGLSISVTRAERDEKGRRLKPAEPDSGVGGRSRLRSVDRVPWHRGWSSVSTAPPSRSPGPQRADRRRRRGRAPGPDRAGRRRRQVDGVCAGVPLSALARGHRRRGTTGARRPPSHPRPSLAP